MRAIGLSCLAAAILAMASTPITGSYAQPAVAPASGTLLEWAQCKGGSGTSQDTQLSACTALIQSLDMSNNKDQLAEALQTRCSILDDKGERDAAIRDCGRAIELKPDYTDAYRTRAVAYLAKRDYDHAIADCSSMIALKPDSAGTLILRGMAYAGKGDYDLAIEDYSHALRLRPGLGMAEGGLTEARTAKARLAGGQTLGDPRAWCKGKSLPQEGFSQDLQISGCTTLIQSGKERRSNLAEDYFNRASARNFGGDSEHAIGDYVQVLKLNPKNAEAYYRLGSIYWVKGDYDRAASYLDRAVKLKPNTTMYLLYRGYARYGKNQFGRAIADFGRVIKLQPDDAEAFLNRSLSYIGQGDYDRALADCRQAIRLSRTSEATEGHNSCGNAYFRKGDMENAIADFDAALKLWPEYPEALYGRGCVKVRNGDVVGGRSDMEQARKLKPEIETVEANLGIKP